jgi:AAA ATPase domain
MSSDVVGLLGREKTIEVIRRFLEEAAVDGRALLFTGPTGIGRTAVIEAAVTMAVATGAMVLTAAGVADESDVPFAGLSQLLTPLDGVVQLDPGQHRRPGRPPTAPPIRGDAVRLRRRGQVPGLRAGRAQRRPRTSPNAGE